MDITSKMKWNILCESDESYEETNHQQYYKVLEITLKREEYTEEDVQLLSETMQKYYEEKNKHH